MHRSYLANGGLAAQKVESKSNRLKRCLGRDRPLWHRETDERTAQPGSGVGV